MDAGLGGLQKCVTVMNIQQIPKVASKCRVHNHEVLERPSFRLFHKVMYDLHRSDSKSMVVLIGSIEMRYVMFDPLGDELQSLLEAITAKAEPSQPQVGFVAE